MTRLCSVSAETPLNAQIESKRLCPIHDRDSRDDVRISRKHIYNPMWFKRSIRCVGYLLKNTQRLIGLQVVSIDPEIDGFKSNELQQ
jgi:hypothetical protein